MDHAGHRHLTIPIKNRNAPKQAVRNTHTSTFLNSSNVRTGHRAIYSHGVINKERVHSV